MSNCIDGFIRLKGCEFGNQFDGGQGLYLDMLPFMSLANVSDMTDDKFVTAQDMVARKLQFAALKIAEVLNAELAKRGYKRRFFNETESGRVEGGVNTAMPMQQGLCVTNLHHTSNTAIHVDSIVLHDYNNSGLNTSIGIYDEHSNLLHTQTLNGLEAKIDRTFDVRRIFILHGGNISTRQTSTKGTCGTCGIVLKQPLHYQGWSGATFVQDNAFGFVAKCRAVCSDNLVCAFKEELKLVLLYLTAAGVAEEVVASTRVNYLTLNSTEEAKRYAEVWRTEASEAMNLAMLNISPKVASHDKVCYFCESQYSTVNINPA